MAQTYAHLLQNATRQLAIVGINDAAGDAALLAQQAFNMTRTDFLLHADTVAPADRSLLYQGWLAQRAAHMPVHRIIGWREFWGLRFVLSPDTLEPRPDSETLLETAQRYYLDRNATLQVLDLGTGTGCLLLGFLHDYPEAAGTGIDIAEGAITIAARNAKNNSLNHRCQFQVGDWGAALTGPYDLIFSNPPYIEQDDIENLAAEVKDHDPRRALDGGPDGCDAYRALLPDVVRLLADGGHALLEIGSNQTAHVTDIAKQFGLRIVETVTDLGGQPRCLVLQRSA